MIQVFPELRGLQPQTPGSYDYGCTQTFWIIDMQKADDTEVEDEDEFREFAVKVKMSLAQQRKCTLHIPLKSLN